MISACVNGCADVIRWRPGWHEWHGHCATCKGFFVYADPAVEDWDKAVCVLPAGSQWQRVERADAGLTG